MNEKDIENMGFNSVLQEVLPPLSFFARNSEAKVGDELLFLVGNN